VRIAVVANSQGTATGVQPEEAYPERLRALLAPEHEVIPYAVSGWAIRDFNEHVAEVLALKPDLVVLQVGIVECSRRILSAREKRVLGRIRGSARLTKWLHGRRQTVIVWRSRLRIDTRLYAVPEFAEEVARLLLALRAGAVDVLVLETPQFGSGYERLHFPLINEDIELFNRVLRRHGSVAMLAPGDDAETIWQTGTVHFDTEGHRLVAERLAARLSRRDAVVA